MKKIIVFTLVFLSYLTQASAQQGTLVYLDKENGINDISLGADISTITQKGFKYSSQNSGVEYYTVFDGRTFYLGDEKIKTRTSAIGVYHNKIMSITMSFKKDGPEMLNELIALYGPYTGRTKSLDKYFWESGQVKVVMNYTDPKDKYISFFDVKTSKQYQLGFDSLRKNKNALPKDTAQHKQNYFIAMEYIGFSNCIYKIFVTDSLLMCAKVNGYITVEPNIGIGTSISKSKMHDPEAYIDRKMDAKYDSLKTDINAFLKADRLNFIIRKKDIKYIFNDASKKWGMGYYPYGGRIIVRLKSTSFPKEFILVGDQDPAKVISGINLN